MARKYDVEGTRSFLVWSIVLALLCIWAIRDGWFPSASKIELHGPMSASEDPFYSFNRTLAILSGLGSLVCGFIHKFVK